MASYDPYDAPTRDRKRTSYYREEREARYVDPRDNYLNVHSSRDLVPRGREDSDLSVEEIHRDFPPPGYGSRDARRARSAEPSYYEDDYDDRRSTYSRSRHDRDYDRDYDRRSHRGKTESVYYAEEERKKVRMLSKQEQIIAAVTGAALAIGGKELYDRREANQHGTDVNRNIMASAALGAAGALAGYQGTEFYNKKKGKDEQKSTYAYHKGHDGKVSEYYSDEEDGKDKKGHKNFLENALAAAGLGGAVKALTGGSGKDDKSDTRSRRGSRSRSHSRDKGPANKVQKAAMASLIAGATEAFRVSKEPGGWKGEKAKRILTAAAGAATIDAAQNPDKAGSKLGLAESVIGGLVGNRVINGSKKNIEEDTKTGRSRSRSRAARSDAGGGGGGVSGLAALATAGLGAFGAKKIMDNREKSRERSRDRSRRRDSRDSYDSRDASPDKRRRSRSRSVVDGARRSLAKLGIGNGPEDDDRDRDHDRRDRRRDHDDYSDSGRGSRRHRGRDDYDDDKSYRGGRDDYDDDRSRGGRDRSRSRARGSTRRDHSASSSDLGDSDEDEKRAKKMRAHNVYQSMEKRNARHKAVKEGRLSPEEAKKLKTKAIMQDAASVGIAALGIKGAISEMKEAKEMRHELKEWQEQKAERHERRLQRQQKLLTNGGGDGDYDDRDYDDRDRRRAESWSPPRSDRYKSGPHYSDGNPYGNSYATLPPPPLGSSDRNRDRR